MICPKDLKPCCDDLCYGGGCLAMGGYLVQIIAGKTRPTAQAEIESVLFKDGVKVVLTFSKSAADRHAIADAAGNSVLLVLPDYESVLGGDAPKADKDQPELV